MTTKILDCTLRDGGYYTDWDFEPQIIDAYLNAINQLPIDYIEIGYRNLPSKEYLGEYGYCPDYVLQHIRKHCNKKIAIMLNEKSTRPEDAVKLLTSAKGMVDMVRIAINPANLDRAILLAKTVKSMGFEVGFNTMYMSTWKDLKFYPKLKGLEDFSDLFCMVDSYGGVTPQDVRDIIASIRQYTNVPIGFHGHNNLEFGLINTLTAINEGVGYVDATILGMGRGAGNLKMELLLTYLNKNYGLDLDFNVLGEVVSAFTPLFEKYKWGTNLPYMLAGANAFPQKEVMQMVTNRVYSFNSIVRTLSNRKLHVKDNAKFDLLPKANFKKVLIAGGGDSSRNHIKGIKAFIEKYRDNIAVIFATCRNADVYEDLDIPTYFCLVGSESRRLEKKLGRVPENGICVIPPYPREMGTDTSDITKDFTYELEEFKFSNRYPDSCTSLALQLAMDIGEEIYIIGYDGYPDGYSSEKERELTIENKELFIDANNFLNKQLVSLTPTLYTELEVKSLYQFI